MSDLIRDKQQRLAIIARFLEAHADEQAEDAEFVAAFADRCVYDDICFYYLQQWDAVAPGMRADMLAQLRVLLGAVVALDRFDSEKAGWTDESGKWELPGEVLGRLKRSRSDDADHRRALHDRFFANVERLRVERGLLTQRAFADACGLHQSQVSRMEKLRASNPSYLPRLAVRDKIARGLDVSLAELEA